MVQCLFRLSVAIHIAVQTTLNPVWSAVHYISWASCADYRCTVQCVASFLNYLHDRCHRKLFLVHHMKMKSPQLHVTTTKKK